MNKNIEMKRPIQRPCQRQRRERRLSTHQFSLTQCISLTCIRPTFFLRSSTPSVLTEKYFLGYGISIFLFRSHALAPSKDPTQMLSSIFYFKFSVFIAVVHPLLLAAFSFFKKPQRWLSSILFCFRISFSRSSNSNFLLNFHPKQLSQGGGEVSRYHHSGLTGQARQG